MLRRLAMLLGLKAPAVRDKVEERLAERPADARDDRHERGRAQDRLPDGAPGRVPRRPDHRDVPAQLRAGQPGLADPRLRRRDRRRAARERKAEQGYAAGDRIGQTGHRGRLRQVPARASAARDGCFVDALGRITSEREFSQLPEAGDNIRLTIDADLQRAAEDALDYGIRLAHEQGEWAADGGAHRRHGRRTRRDPRARLEPDVRPAASTSAASTRRTSQTLAEPEREPPAAQPRHRGRLSARLDVQAVRRPRRARGRVCSARTSDPVHAARRSIDGQTFMNWDPYKNEPMTVSTALANSCDTFFYNVALRFYERKDSPLQRWSRTMGFGSRHRHRPRARSRRGSCRRRPGAARRSRRRSTGSGRAATPCSWPSARATCS